MKITIDLEDLVNDFIEDAHQGEYGIEDQFELKEEIKQAIVKQVSYANFRNEIAEMRSKAHELLKKRVAEKLDEIIEKQVDRIIKEDKVKFGYSSEPVTLFEYIQKVYMDTSYNRKLKLEDIAKSIADKRAEQMKDRYDLLFASQFVSKLDTIGLLKPDAAKILLDYQNEQMQ